MKTLSAFALMFGLLCGPGMLAADNDVTNGDVRNDLGQSPLNLTNVTPADVDAFLTRWTPVLQTNGFLRALEPMMQSETNQITLTTKLLGALDRNPRSIWIFVLGTVVRPEKHSGLPAPQVVAVWKQACASLEKWRKTASDQDLARFEARLGPDRVPRPSTVTNLEPSLEAEDRKHDLARQEIRMALELARQHLAMASLAAGKDYLEAAKHTARGLLTDTPTNGWNYGNVVYDAHSILGRVALRQADRATARNELRAAGRTPGSPQLNSFGPQFDLARELLEHADDADREAVAAFLDDVAGFWANPDKEKYQPYRKDKIKRRQDIATWKELIRAGEMPDDPKWR